MKILRVGICNDKNFWDGWEVECPRCGCIAVLDSNDKPKCDTMWAGHSTISCPTPGCYGSFSIYRNGSDIKNLSKPEEPK